MQDNASLLGRRRAILASGLAAAAVMVPGVAGASHHFESVAGRKNTKVALTDMYVFKAPDSDRTVFIVSFNYEPKSGEDLLERSALYNIHCATDKAFKAGFTWTFAYDGKRIQCGQLDEANGAVGAAGRDIGHLTLGKQGELAGGIRAWVGQAKDPFFGNSPGLHAFRTQLEQGKYDPSLWEKASGTNIFAGRDCGAIVLEVPNKLLGKEIGVFSTVAVAQEGRKWHQVQYMAKALIAHTMLFDDDPLKTAFDATRPNTQDPFKKIFGARIARAAHFAGGRADAFTYGDQMARQLIPDVLPYEVGSAAAYLPEKFNGRTLTDDAMSTTLTLLFGKPASQHLKDPGNYDIRKFPYVIPT